jgi:DNA-binding transcriptional MerR regulator
MINKNLTIGEVGRRSNCTVKQIRFWAEKEYIPEPERVTSGERSYRIFGADDMELIKSIKFYLDEGYRLPVAVKMANQKKEVEPAECSHSAPEV